ncbi:hypothetical protein SAMN05216553_101437 [Lentzea fradiae]|uniref:Thiazolylpeptide-type bacteriocin n=1 Tax=Lentzea fradiae TaxID=200378 RepID=A0A1G7KRV3_9PSEU|nr:hypothetical protein [Lentzea fradiae]SDF39804.1 hypothetical protein SAMN05216553_101437 [Lentzea fradiae]
MLSADIQDLFELDVEELELVDTPVPAPAQAAPPRTITTCAIC